MKVPLFFPLLARSASNSIGFSALFTFSPIFSDVVLALDFPLSLRAEGCKNRICSPVLGIFEQRKIERKREGKLGELILRWMDDGRAIVQ